MQKPLPPPSPWYLIMLKKPLGGGGGLRPNDHHTVLINLRYMRWGHKLMAIPGGGGVMQMHGH